MTWLAIKKKSILVSINSSFRENFNTGGFAIQIRQKRYIETHKYFYSILFFLFLNKLDDALKLKMNLLRFL